ncbi:NADH-quinone oxidoreductase subunit NuoE [Flexivirga sp. ID2601S]|uniref:NADH-quinone oxidoreductase subunit NuoE n=1 Tax=Flexivirga aerilata TaxID=1656889 RepID=A0A849AH39_9MICO|nr:NADH-quinone oxidoreductase subunit NuoE [Flexivirga aerilata]NNG38876.1 NADH-quinone oxidoreductase subunit NuoE [Flexivirga aerilata]
MSHPSEKGLDTASPSGSASSTSVGDPQVERDLDPAFHELTPLQPSSEPYTEQQLAQLNADSDAIIARYPVKRSALLPMLHLVQSIDGYVTGRGVTFCAEKLDLTDADVAGVATFYTQYKRHPNGEYTVGVCTNTLCAIMGGDLIFDAVSEHLGIGHDETTEDGKVTLERVECNAACDYAPVVMANWEFVDNQTPESAIRLVDDLRAGKPVRPTRGPDRVCTFKQVSRTLAGFPDGLADEGVGAGGPSLEGLKLAKEKGWHAPRSADEVSEQDQAQTSGADANPQPGEEFSSADSDGSVPPAKEAE